MAGAPGLERPPLSPEVAESGMLNAIIIAYASRAFALFYMLQCTVAFLVAWRMKDLAGRSRNLATFLLLAMICLLVFVFGLPSE